MRLHQCVWLYSQGKYQTQHFNSNQPSYIRHNLRNETEYRPWNKISFNVLIVFFPSIYRLLCLENLQLFTSGGRTTYHLLRHYVLNNPLFDSRKGEKDFLTFAKRHGQLWSLTSLHSFPRVQRPKRKFDNSPPSGAEVKNGWTYTSVPLQGVDRDNFTLLSVSSADEF